MSPCVSWKLHNGKTTIYKSQQSIEGYLSAKKKNECVKNSATILMFVCSTDLYKYMKSLRNDTCAK